MGITLILCAAKWITKCEIAVVFFIRVGLGVSD